MIEKIFIAIGICVWAILAVGLLGTIVYYAGVCKILGGIMAIFLICAAAYAAIWLEDIFDDY